MNLQLMIKPFCFLLLSFIMALVTTFMIFRYIEQQEINLKKAYKVDDFSEILVPNKNILTGEVFSSENLSVLKVPDHFVSEQILTVQDFDRVNGLASLKDLSEGKPIFVDHVDFMLDAGRLSQQIKVGERVIIFPVDHLNANEYMIKVGDQLDLVFFSMKDLEKKVDPAPIWVYENAKVIATGDQYLENSDEDHESGNGSYQSITVSVNEKALNKLIFYRDQLNSSELKLSFLLKNAEDKTSITKLLSAKTDNVKRKSSRSIVVLEGNDSGIIDKKIVSFN